VLAAESHSAWAVCYLLSTSWFGRRTNSKEFNLCEPPVTFITLLTCTGGDTHPTAIPIDSIPTPFIPHRTVIPSLVSQTCQVVNVLTSPKLMPCYLRCHDDNIIMRRKLPRVQTSTGQRSFAYSGTAVWNNLPPALREHMSLAAFKSKLKTYLFRRSQ